MLHYINFIKRFLLRALLCPGLLFALLSPLAFSHNGIVQTSDINGRQVKIPFFQATVCVSSDTAIPCSNKATIYTNENLHATAAYPITGDASGDFVLYTTHGIYNNCVSAVTVYCQKIAVTTSKVGTGIEGTPTAGTHVTGNESVSAAQPKLHFDTRDYGIKSDGSSNDTAAMNTLLTGIGSTRTKILFPGGQTVLGNISFPANVTLDFSSGGALKLITGTTPPGGARFVQGSGTSHDAGGSSSCSVSLNSTTAHNTIVFILLQYQSGQNSPNTPTDGSNNYRLIKASTAGQAPFAESWFASDIEGGTVTITAPVTDTMRNACIAQEYSGLGPTPQVDGTGSSGHGGGSSSHTLMDSGAASTAVGSLLIAYGGQSTPNLACTAGPGYTQPAGTAGSVGVHQTLCTEYKLSSAGRATGAHQNTLPSKTTWVYDMIALRPGSATVTVLGGIIDPDLHQVFYNALTGQGTIDITGNLTLPKVYPEWWGASPSASAVVNTATLQAAEHAAFGTNRSNDSGLAQYNRELHLSGNYRINEELQFYHVLNFRVTCDGRLNAGITQTAINKRIIDGQSIAYGSFDDCSWTNLASSTKPQIDLDYDGVTTLGDLRPQFIDFNRNNFVGNGITDVGVLIAKSGGIAQGSNIYCNNCAGQGFTGAVWQVGGNNAGRNAGRFYAQNALAIGWYGGDMQNCPLYGFADYGGGVIDINGTTFECISPWGSYSANQAGFDFYCEAPQGTCSMEHVRSEDMKLIAGGTIWVVDSGTGSGQAHQWDTSHVAGSISALNEVIWGTANGGDGAYYKVTNSGVTFGGLDVTTATSGSATTIVNSEAKWTVNGFSGQQATITGGTGNGEFCIITSNTATIIACAAGWVTNYAHLPIVSPDKTSTFVVEPNWTSNPTSSGRVTFTKMNFNVIGGSAGNATSNCHLEHVSAPGGQVGCGGTFAHIDDLIVSRPDWNSAGDVLDDTAVTGEYKNILLDRGGNGPGNRRLKWNFQSRNGPAQYTNYAQYNLGTQPIVWSCGQNGGGPACKDVAIGGRNDSQGTSFSRGVLEVTGVLGPPTQFGTDKNGTSLTLQGGLPTGAGTPGTIDFYMGRPAASGTTITDGTKVASLSSVGKFSTYNSLTTTGSGVPPVLGSTSQTRLTANLAAVTLYTTAASGPGSAGTYRVCFNAYTSTPGTGTTSTVQVFWNDGNAKTFESATWALNAIDITGQVNACQIIHSGASQSIKVGTARGTYGTSVYGLDATVEQLQ